MLYMFRYSRSLPTILSALVILGMWGTAMAAVFCPHMSGSPYRCPMESSHPHSDGSVSNAQISMEHMDHTQMSDSNMDMSADMSDMQMDGPKSQPENGSVKTEDLQVAQDSP